MSHAAVLPSAELAKAYLQSNFPKDDPLSDELSESLWSLAGDAALQGDMELSERAMDRIPMDAAFFLELKMLLPKEDVAQIVEGMNMSKVIELFGEDYL